MARFWVGGTGIWNDTTHWSTSSGGGSGASVPTSTDDVNFDANSFSASGQIVTINDSVGNGSCQNINFTGITHNPTLAFTSNTSGVGLTVSASMTLASGLSITLGGTSVHRNSAVSFKPGANISIDNKGIDIPLFVNIDPTAASVTASVSSDFSSTVGIQLGLTTSQDFTFTTNNHSVTAGSINIANGTHVVTVNAGTTVFTISGFTDTDGSIINGVTFNNSNSIYSGSSSEIDLTYTANLSNSNSFDLQMFGQTLGTVKPTGTSTLANPYYFIDETFGSPGSTITTLTLKSGNFIQFDFGGTYICTNFNANGTSGNLITLRSDSSGRQYTISSTTPSISFVDVKDCIAAGSIPFNDASGVDSGNNVNWTFTSATQAGFLKLMLI